MQVGIALSLMVSGSSALKAFKGVVFQKEHDGSIFEMKDGIQQIHFLSMYLLIHKILD